MAEPHRADRVACAGVWGVVLALTAWSAWHRWDVLTGSPYPVGIDGYFYPLQVRSLIETGDLAYRSAPLTFWLMLPLGWLTDPFTAAKLVAAGVVALAAIPAFLLGRRVGGAIGGVAAAVLVVTSGGSFFLSLEFVKNGVGLTVALTAGWLAARALERPNPGRIGLAMVAVVATVLAHKLAAVLLIALVAPAVVIELRARSSPARVVRAVMLASAVGLLLSAMAGEGFFGLRDLALVEHAFTREAEWELPALAIRYPHRPPFRLWLGHQGVITLAVASWFCIATALAGRSRARRAARPADDAIAWSAFALALSTCVPWLAVDDAQGLGFRLRVVGFVPAAIVLAAASGRATAGLTPWWRLGVIGPALAGWLMVRPAAPTEGLVTVHPTMVAAMQTLPGRLPDGAVVISAQRDLGFMAAWYGRVAVRLRPELVPPARRWRMIPLGLIGMGSKLDQALTDARHTVGVAPPIGLHPGHPNGLVLIPEPTWEWVLSRLPPPLATHWREWHPI